MYILYKRGDEHMIYMTGDKHRRFGAVNTFCSMAGTTLNDTLVILGDAGINFTGNEVDTELKKKIDGFPIKLLCVHGNHEQRPYNFASYKEVPFLGGIAYAEQEHPTIFFAKDGEVYDFGGKKALILGGAYSVDKHYRLAHKLGWWPDEQPSAEIKAYVEERLRQLDYKVDYVFSHTCPTKYIPTEMFLKGIDQSTVDRSTEDWLDAIESKLTYDRWYCGHWHTNKRVDKMCFLFEDYVELGK